MSIAEWTVNINVNSDEKRARVLSWTVEEGLLGAWSMAKSCPVPLAHVNLCLLFIFLNFLFSIGYN